MSLAVDEMAVGDLTPHRLFSKMTVPEMPD
jgi:hypothetical protein